jgi:DNA-binding NarL/FixJ family response regulator
VIRVLLADDEALIRHGFRIILAASADIQVVGEASTGDEAVRLAHEVGPDVVLMDIRMPGLSGIAATRRIVDELGTRVVVVTTFDHDDHIHDALRAGAIGFLVKNSTPEQLVEAVRVAARGDGVLSPEVTRRLIAEVAARPNAAPDVAQRLRELTEREAEVLGLIADGRSNSEIATALTLTEATVKTHVTRVLMKLDVRDRTQAAILAIRAGLGPVR